jgi:hypothetical protein
VKYKSTVKMPPAKPASHTMPAVERHQYGQRVGNLWTLRYAKVEQLQRLLKVAGADPVGFVNGFKVNRTLVLGASLYESITGWKVFPMEDEDDEDIRRAEAFWESAFFEGQDINDRQIALGFVEGVLAGWKEVMADFRQWETSQNPVSTEGGTPS